MCVLIISTLTLLTFKTLPSRLNSTIIYIGVNDEFKVKHLCYLFFVAKNLLSLIWRMSHGLLYFLPQVFILSILLQLQLWQQLLMSPHTSKNFLWKFRKLRWHRRNYMADECFQQVFELFKMINISVCLMNLTYC